MKKSYMSEIAKMLGLELNEEFKLEGYGDGKFRFTHFGVETLEANGIWVTSDVTLRRMLADGIKPIIKPFRPAVGDIYWFLNQCNAESTWVALDARWKGNTSDLMRWEMGNVFRTREQVLVYEDDIIAKFADIRKRFESESQEVVEND